MQLKDLSGLHRPEFQEFEKALQEILGESKFTTVFGSIESFRSNYDDWFTEQHRLKVVLPPFLAEKVSPSYGKYMEQFYTTIEELFSQDNNDEGFEIVLRELEERGIK